MDPPEGDMTRDEIIDSYIKTLAMVLGSEEEARMKIYSVSTRHYYAFGALVPEDLSHRVKELPKVRWVLPDSYLDVKNKDYGGEPFINGQAVPYDPKYHEEWVRNNDRANDRNRRNDRPRNFERRRDMQMNNQNTGGNVGGPSGGNMGGPQNFSPPPQNAPNSGGMGHPNYRGGPSANNAPNYQYRPNSGPVSYQSGPGPNPAGFAPGIGPGQGQNPNNAYGPPNMGGGNPYQSQNVPPQPPNSGFGPGQNGGGFGPNMGYGPGQNQNFYGQNQNGYAPNVGPDGHGQSQGGYGNPSQNLNVPGRDPNY